MATSLNQRRWPSGAPRARVPVVIASYKDGRCGARFWGQVRGFSGWLRAAQGKGAASRETSKIAGEAHNQARFRDHVAVGRSLHGKEGVDGSSPSEGSIKGQQMAFFVASIAYAHWWSIPQPVPKICPQRCGGPYGLA